MCQKGRSLQANMLCISPHVIHVYCWFTIPGRSMLEPPESATSPVLRHRAPTPCHLHRARAFPSGLHQVGATALVDQLFGRLEIAKITCRHSGWLKAMKSFRRSHKSVNTCQNSLVVTLSNAFIYFWFIIFKTAYDLYRLRSGNSSVLAVLLGSSISIAAQPSQRSGTFPPHPPASHRNRLSRPRSQCPPHSAEDFYRTRSVGR